MVKPLQYVSKIRPYVPGKPIEEVEREFGLKDSIKLASNENPIGPSKKVVSAIMEFIKRSDEIARYPDGGGYYLKDALSEHISTVWEGGETMGVEITPEHIILGNGSNELIDIAVRTYMGPGDEAIAAIPSFPIYAMSVHSVGGIIHEVPLIEYRHDLAKMAEHITGRTKIVFVANPNNPTGTINRRDEFDAFMQLIPEGVLVVIDEAYFEYVVSSEYPDSLSYFRDGKDVLILRTFSKAYGLASLRIGYGITRRAIVEEMNKIRAPFNTGSLAQIAAQQALADDEHLRHILKVNEEGKQFLYGELEALGIPYVPTEANFIYLPLGPIGVSSKVVYERLLHMGVIVRTVGPKEIRITIGVPDENKRLVRALKTVMQTV